MSSNEPIPFEQALRSRLEASQLPGDRYFTVKEWESLMENRDLLFTQLGQFRTASREQFREIEKQLRVEQQPEGKHQTLCEGVLGVMGRLSEQAHQSARAGQRKFGFHLPAPQAGSSKAVEFRKENYATPPGRGSSNK